MTEYKDKTNTILENSKIILDELKKLDPAKNEVSASYFSENKVIYEASDYLLSSGSTGHLYGVRSIVNDRLGFMNTNATDRDSLKRAAHEAQQMAKLSVPNPHNQIAELNSKTISEANWDTSLSCLSPKEVIDYTQLLIDELTKEGSIAIDRVEFELRTGVQTIINSNGIKQQVATTSCDWFAMGMGKSATEVTSFDYDGSIVSNLKNLESEIIRSMKNLRGSLINSLGAKKGESYKGAVLLHPQAVIELVAALVATNCDGKLQQDGLSSWREKLGNEVTSPLLNIYENPLDKTRPWGWTPFDREGVPTSKHFLIKNGVLNFVAHNCFSAHKSGCAPTGNASGSVNTLPGIGFCNLTVKGTEGTKYSSYDLMKLMGDGLVVKRFSGNNDNISGQFSGIAKNSWWVSGGQRAHAVNEVMISGNLFEAIKNVKAVGSDMFRCIGDSMAPYMLIDGVSVTAS